MAAGKTPAVGEARQRQRLAALDVANARRRRRADLKQQLRARKLDGLRLVAGEIEEWEADIESWRLDQLVKAVPGIGTSGLVEILSVFRASPRMKVSALTERRRKELAALCGQYLGREKF